MPELHGVTIYPANQARGAGSRPAEYAAGGDAVGQTQTFRCLSIRKHSQIHRETRRPECSHPVKGIRGPAAGQKPRPYKADSKSIGRMRLPHLYFPNFHRICLKIPSNSGASRRPMRKRRIHRLILRSVEVAVIRLV